MDGAFQRKLTRWFCFVIIRNLAPPVFLSLFFCVFKLSFCDIESYPSPSIFSAAFHPYQILSCNIPARSLLMVEIDIGMINGIG
jgi:hypothetical protein